MHELTTVLFTQHRQNNHDNISQCPLTARTETEKIKTNDFCNLKNKNKKNRKQVSHLYLE